jgi:alginate O-acetyltransferase complex protein AlgI
VNGYVPRDPVTVAVVAIVLLATLLVGPLLYRLPPGCVSRSLAWLLTIGATAGVERLCRDEPAGVRMLAIIGALLYGMKAVVSVEARAERATVLSARQWLGFAILWPGMRPALFATAGHRRQPGGWGLIGHGCLCVAVGLALGVLACLVWHRGRPPLSRELACILVLVLLLPAVSLVVHFGVFNVLAGLWRFAGVDARPLFRRPLAARSLDDFWSRRWNLPFSEMMTLGIYRPLSGRLGRKGAIVAAFVASGLLHELAISLPVRAGFGLPLSYFLLQGTLVLAERGLERAGRAVPTWGWCVRVWVLGWLAVPVPILFHLPFLRGVVWPLIGVE